MSTWRSAASFLFSREGFIRGNVAAWRAYTRAGFHPSQGPGELGERWLAEHADDYSVVGGSRAVGTAA
jgi:predicted metal-dependent hydrolase